MQIKIVKNSIKIPSAVSVKSLSKFIFQIKKDELLPASFYIRSATLKWCKNGSLDLANKAKISWPSDDENELSTADCVTES